MISYIWAGMLIIGFVVGAATGNLEAVTKAAIDNAQSAFELSLGLVGVMSLWLGLMRIAEESGIVEKLARAQTCHRKVVPRCAPGTSRYGRYDYEPGS